MVSIWVRVLTAASALSEQIGEGGLEGKRARMLSPKPNPFRYFNSSPEVIRLAVMMYVRYPLSLRNAEDLLHERGVDICHQTVRFCWNRLGPLFAGDIRKRRVRAASFSLWHVDEVFVKVNGELPSLAGSRSRGRGVGVLRQ